MRTFIAVCLAIVSLHAVAEDKKPQGTLITFSLKASQPVANDQAHATLFAQANAPTSAEVSRKVNDMIRDALARAKAVPDVKAKSGSTWTSPMYDKNGRNIVGWQMRSELQLESQNVAALSDLVGKLQETLGVSQIYFQPAPETRRRAEEQVTLDALNAFQAKAQRIAGNFKKYYRVVRMNVDGAGAAPIRPFARDAVMMKTEAAPMPMEGGDSAVSVTVNGEIELVD